MSFEGLNFVRVIFEESRKSRWLRFQGEVWKDGKMGISLEVSLLVMRWSV